jgi:hypothetical protein
MVSRPDPLVPRSIRWKDPPMSPLERRSLKVGTMLLLVLWALSLAVATVNTVQLFWSPVHKGVGASIPVSVIIMMIAHGLIIIGYIVAYVKLMGAGNIRDKALALLILSIVTVVLGVGGSPLVSELGGDPVHLVLGVMLPVRIVSLISAIVLIKMLVQAAHEAGGKLPGLVSGTYVGLVVLYFIVGFIGIVWRIVDVQAWYFEPDSTARMARPALNAIRAGVHYVKEAIEAAALVIVLRLVK